MPYQSAIAELELADAYLELNLAPEAAAIYERVISIFETLGMRFFSAGASTLLVSLWTVDDETTAEFMYDFYMGLRGGQRPATALRNAQRIHLARHPHPFFWSPFMLLGRW